MAQDDLPILPSNFFNDPEQSGRWKWETDFKDVVEIGKGKVRAAVGAGWAGGGGVAVVAASCPTLPCRACPSGCSLIGADSLRPSGTAFCPLRALRPQDTVIYSAVCPRLGTSRRVAVKVYDKTKVQATKYRAIKREIAMMMYFMRKRCVDQGHGAEGQWWGMYVGSCSGGWVLAGGLGFNAKAWPAPAPSAPRHLCPCRLPSVVYYYGAFHDEAHLYIVMEYCGGGDLLEKLLRDKKAMNEKKVAIEVALPCLSILKTLHEMRIIHRWGAGRQGCLRQDGRAGMLMCRHACLPTMDLHARLPTSLLSCPRAAAGTSSWRTSSLMIPGASSW